MIRTQKTIWYKRARLPEQRVTLQTHLLSALRQRPMAGDRLTGLADESEQLGINLFNSRRELLFGQFLCFQPGMRQAVMTLDDRRTAFDLATIAAEVTGDGKKREFLESIGYFGVIDNHVLLVQTKALASREFEAYLIWLLSEATTSIPKGTMLTLYDPVANTARRNAAGRNVRGVTIGTQLRATPKAEVADTQAVTKYELNGVGFDALRGLLGAQIFEKLSLENSLADDNIEVQLTVRIKGRRVASEDGQKLLRAVGRATRHMDARDYALELDKNGQLSGADLRLHRSVPLHANEDSGLIDESALASHMIAWLAELNEKGLVDP